MQVVDAVERTSTVVRTLEGDSRVQELTAMLGTHSAAGRRSVEEMLEEVAVVKQGRSVRSA